MTDYGRKLLAENQGAFRIAFFSLGDDEVDYTIIKKFGRTVGKEKITKNTPIFEAQTSAQRALKHRLITLPDPLVSKIPRLNVTNPATVVDNTISLDSNTSLKTITFGQEQTTGETAIGMSDQTYTIMVNSRFLDVTSATGLQTEPNTRIRSYSQVSTNVNSLGKSSISVEIRKKGLDPISYSQFGDGTQIMTVLTVVGDQSGLRSDVKIKVIK